MTNSADEKPEPRDEESPDEPDRRAFFRGILGPFIDPVESEDAPGGEQKTKGEEGVEDRKVDRRDFFKEVFRSVAEPIADQIENQLQAFSPPSGIPDRYLRPPGAQYEYVFQSVCSRCSKCVEVCPVNAIKIMQSADPDLHGTPYIVPAVQACVVCEELSCMNVCPSGALKPISKNEIRMGLASMNYSQCLRSDDEDCRICVEKCPIGEEALVVHEGRIEVMFSGCVGCGVCEQQCPTAPKSITIEPG